MSINEHCLLWTVRIKHFWNFLIWVPGCCLQCWISCKTSWFAGYELRRLTTRRAKFFPEAREELLRKAQAWTVLLEPWPDALWEEEIHGDIRRYPKSIHKESGAFGVKKKSYMHVSILEGTVDIVSEAVLRTSHALNMPIYCAYNQQTLLLEISFFCELADLQIILQMFKTVRLLSSSSTWSALVAPLYFPTPPNIQECPATSWTIELLNGSAFADRNHASGEADLAHVIKEILSAGQRTMMQTLSSRLGLFGLLGLAGRRKLSQRTSSPLSPVIWDIFTELPHWSMLQRDLWKAIRSRRPLPLSGSILGLSQGGPSGTLPPLPHVVLLFASAQEIRLRSGDILSANTIRMEVTNLVLRASEMLEEWGTAVTVTEMIRGLRDWPLVQLLADLEVSDLAELQAMGRHLLTQQQVRFLPSPNVAWPATEDFPSSRLNSWK